MGLRDCDLAERRLEAQPPHQLWVADITHIRILNEFCYVAFVTDAHSLRIVGWTVSSKQPREPAEAGGMTRMGWAHGWSPDRHFEAMAYRAHAEFETAYTHDHDVAPVTP